MQPHGKQTAIPHGWQRVRLGDVADVKGGAGFPPARQGRTSGDYPFIKVSDMTLKGNETYIRLANNYVDEQDVADLGAVVFPSGTVVFPKVGAAIATNKKRSLTVPTIIDNNMVGVTVSGQERCDARFLHNWFESVDISQFANVSTVPSITTSRLKTEEILLPPLAEQRAIAAVLDSIDDAIEGAEEAIAATEGLRDALLHDLLTRGLPGQHTEFREVLGLGTIPADWDVVRLGNKLEDGPTNGIYKPDSDYGSGVCLIRIDDFGFGEFESFGNFQRIRATEDEIRRYEVREGDIVVNRVNSLSHIGKSVLIPKVNEPTLFESNMMRIRFDRTLDSRFGAMVLLSDDTRRYFKARAKKAVQQASINQQDVNELPIPLPPLAEQRTIAGALYGVDAAIEVAGEERDGLRLLKGSTADALLTGRARLQI